MKSLRLVLLVAILLFPAYSYPSTLDSLYVNLIDGDVQIRTEEADEWVPASINMPLRDGDQIWVPEGGRAELRLRDGTFLRLNEKSALEILRIDKDSSQFYLNEGQAYANFKGLRDTLLQIDTPLSSVRAYDRSIFRIDLSPDGYTDISVYLGSVYAENREGRTRIDNDKTLSLGEGAQADLSPMGPPDEWERWNQDRNRKFSDVRPPSPYLPEELRPYSNDFAENGRWVNVREYGYVWTPTVVVSTGWAPYRIGRWVWVGDDYVWISYERWGWVPYHYGRWAYAPSVGWCWVPPRRGDVYWGPGYVGWVQTPTYVAWVPLAPGEIYYGHGHYGPHSVNITNVNITNIQVTRIVYKNVHVQNSFTVIHHDTFVKGRHVDIRVKANPFLTERVHIGRPNIKPERPAFMPVIKEIPEKRRPPVAIREIKVRELREKRPLVKEREVSVLRPEARPKEMPIRIREGKPPERAIEKPKAVRPPERGIEKPKEVKPPERGIQKPIEVRPPERKEIEKPRPVERGIEKPKEMKPPERGIGKPAPIQKGLERPKEVKPPERGIEKPKESRPPEKREIGPAERGIEKPRPAEKRMEREKESKPEEKGGEKPR